MLFRLLSEISFEKHNCQIPVFIEEKDERRKCIFAIKENKYIIKVTDILDAMPYIFVKVHQRFRRK
jgi:hypothetical protein